MTLLAVAHLAAAWAIWNAVPAAVEDPEPPRIIGPAPSVFRSATTHLGVRWSTDDISDQAISVQLRAAWISL